MHDRYFVEYEPDTTYARELWLNIERLALAEEDVVLDMSTVKFLDSQGVGAVVALMHRLKVKGLRLKIKGLQGQPRQLLFNLHLIPILECAP
ncbi:MAG: STAS domain-containing protein [Rhodomicrobium sp.]|jgi:anti-anti-sigma factor